MTATEQLGAGAAAAPQERRAARRLRLPGGVATAIAAIVLGTAVLWALFPGLFTAVDPILPDTPNMLQPPSAAHPFGTDHLGRDVLARTIHGSALSLYATLLAVLIAFAAGSAIGVGAGFVGGVVDAVLMRVVDIVMSIPGLLLAMGVVTALGFGTTNIAIAVGIAATASFARLARGEVIRWRTSVFAEAARWVGVSPWRILWRYLLPLALKPVVALGVLEFGSAVIAVSTLSFLGFGQPPPAPEWGLLVAEGRDYLATAWWLTTFPGLVIVAVVLSANQLSRAIQGGRR
ncbi:ABC transporter permease [Microbacterium marinilacus]|uniref:ABC transporter permease n=1 Tax=Microbacterium marinilacus TaxID=415209 RepID=A0ABP7BUG9_9MICO|nr:ABC transporter permease [Microbacterium marinilacus]MBY0688155.1 ABC transporter permease [Microbacterium marinilacus]